jgi:regulator of replication initiation timing
MGCGPESDIGKLKEQLAEVEKCNKSLLRKNRELLDENKQLRNKIAELIKE